MTFLAILTAVGGFGVGAIVASFVSSGVEIAKHRQAWINGLRDDISEVVARRFEWSALPKGRRSDCEHLLRAAHSRVELRLNLSEADHRQLQKTLSRFALLSDAASSKDRDALALLDISRRVLKREWEVTKLGWMAGPAALVRPPTTELDAWLRGERKIA